MMNKIISNTKLDFNDVLIVPKSSYVESRKLVNLKRTIKFRNNRPEWNGVPIISSNMDTVTDLTTFRTLSKHNYLSCFPKHFNKTWLTSAIPNELKQTDSYILSCGIGNQDIDQIITLLAKLSDQGIFPKFLCVDVANGYLVKLISVCATLRDKFPNIILIAGNIVTPDVLEDLVYDGGVDIVKLGIGSGQLCMTRKQTGIGYPQLSCILECTEVAKSLNAHIISDGGITCPGDLAKAYCAGASFVMLGSYLAGHDESPGVEKNGYKLIYGMSSSIANDKHNNGLQNYKASEGRVVRIPIKGPLEKTIQEIEGGLRSCCTYINARNISEMNSNSHFIKVNNQFDKTLESYTVGL